jgi:hypothetical protein
MICPVRGVVCDDAMKLLMDTSVYGGRWKITGGSRLSHERHVSVTTSGLTGRLGRHGGYHRRNA